MNGALTIIAAILPPHKQPMVMGINVGLGQIGIACGPLIGGAFTEYVSWRWCFYINLPIGALVTALLVLVHIPETTIKQPPRKVLGTAIQSLDLPGFALVAPAAIMFFLALQYGGNQYAWGSSTVIGLFVGSAATFAVFLVWEYHQGDEAMIPFFMLRKRITWSASATMFFFMGVLFIGNYYLPIYFQSVRNDSALMSGVHLLPTIVTQVLFAMTSGVSVEIFGYYLPWVLSGTVITSIAYGLLSLLSPSTSVAKWVGYQILFGVGCGSAATGSFIAIQNLIPAAQIPIAMAILIFTQSLGAGVLLVAAQTVFTNTLRKEILSGEELVGVLKAYSKSVDRVMYLGAGTAVASFVFAWGLGFKDIRKEKKKAEFDKSELTNQERSNQQIEDIDVKEK